MEHLVLKSTLYLGHMWATDLKIDLPYHIEVYSKMYSKN